MQAGVALPSFQNFSKLLQGSTRTPRLPLRPQTTHYIITYLHKVLCSYTTKAPIGILKEYIVASVTHSKKENVEYLVNDLKQLKFRSCIALEVDPTQKKKKKWHGQSQNPYQVLIQANDLADQEGQWECMFSNPNHTRPHGLNMKRVPSSAAPIISRPNNPTCLHVEGGKRLIPTSLGQRTYWNLEALLE